MQDNADRLVGKRLGSYLLEGVLGGGDTGTVYAAIDPDTGKRAAIKVIRPEIASTPWRSSGHGQRHSPVRSSRTTGSSR